MGALDNRQYIIVKCEEAERINLENIRQIIKSPWPFCRTPAEAKTLMSSATK